MKETIKYIVQQKKKNRVEYYKKLIKNKLCPLSKVQWFIFYYQILRYLDFIDNLATCIFITNQVALCLLKIYK